jgi:hypothetical protein
LAAGVVSAPVAALSEKVVKAMFLAQLKTTLAVLVVGGFLALGVGAVAARQLLAASPAREEQGLDLAAAPAPRDGARPFLRQALETAQAITDPREKFAALLRIAAVQNETGDAAGARKTCRAALEVARGFPNDRSKVEALASRLALIQAEAGDRDGAAETLKQAKQAANDLKDENQKGNALVHLVGAYGFAGDYEAALRTAKESGRYQAAALQGFVWSLRKPDKPAARKVLREAVALLKSLPKNNQRQYLPRLAAAQVRVGDLEGALQAIEPLDAAWKRIGQEPIAVAQAQTGDVAGALETLKAIQRDEPRGRVLQAVARAQAKAGERAAAEGTLKAVRKIVDDLYVWEAKLAARPRVPREMKGVSKAAELEAQIALTQYLLGDGAGARRTALGIKAEYEKARAFLDLGEAAAAAGKREEARKLLLAAAQAAASVRPGAARGDWPPESAKNSTLRVIAEQQAKNGDVREALRTAEAIGGDRERETALGLVVPAQAEAGDVKGALGALARIKGSAWKGYALEGIVQARVKAGDERGALAVVAEQTSPALKVRALLGLAKGRAGKK